MKRFIFSVLIGLCAFVFVTPAYAIEWKEGDTVTITKDQTIASTLIITGNAVVVDGSVHGDVFCAGKTVTISGTVDGDVLCAAQELIVSGTVMGDVRIAAQSLTITGSVGRNATLLGQSIIVAPTAKISGEVVFGAQSLLSKGDIGPLSGASKSLDMSGNIRGDTNVYASDITIQKEARMFGSLRYVSEVEAKISDGVAVSGTVSHVIPQGDKTSKKPSVQKTMTSWPANALTSVIFYLLLSLVANALFAKKIQQVGALIEKRWLFSIGVGLLACIALPFLSLFLLVTIIGILLIPVPILGVMVATAFGRIVAAQVFGKSVLKGFQVKHADNLYMQSLIGIPILFCMFKAPFVGGLFSFITIILGLGAFILSFQKSKK